MTKRNCTISLFKHCTKCGQELPSTLEYFGPDKRYKNDLKSWCRECSRAYGRERGHLRYEKRRQDPGYIQSQREYHKVWYEKKIGDSEFVRRRAAYRQSERGKLAVQAGNANRRARKLAATGSYSKQDVEVQYHSQNGFCWWCGKLLGNDRSVDHRIPLSRGGSNGARNIVIAHRHCNQSKFDKMPWEYNGRLL